MVISRRGFFTSFILVKYILSDIFSSIFVSQDKLSTRFILQLAQKVSRHLRSLLKDLKTLKGKIKNRDPFEEDS